MSEDRAKLSSGARHSLPDSAFAFIEPGHESEKVDGRTPDKYRHFPVHDAAHARNALARIGQGARFGSQAKAKVMAAAKRFGVHHDADDTGRAMETLFPEVRYVQDRPEIRSADGERATISGYAAVFGKTSRRLGNFHEQVMPTAFTEALRNLADVNVVCRYNHKDDMVLGTSQAGTLRLAVDDRGLKYEVDPPRHRGDVLELVERGDVRYSSFAFRVANPGEDDTWGESEFGLPMRHLHRVELVDVAPVLDPAYKDTSAMARNLAGAIESLASWVDADPSEVRSILEAGQASKFFRVTRRTGTAVLPKPEAGEARMLDDQAVALRRWSLADEDTPLDDDMVPEDDRSVRTEDELRAALKNYDQLCRRYHHGEPCVRPDGHPAKFAGTGLSEVEPDVDDEGHRSLCWGRSGGVPCNQPEGHGGKHTPMTVNSRDGEEAADPAEVRSSPEPATLSGPEAMRKMFDRKKNLTQLPE